jgi:hypothetical protein
MYFPYSATIPANCIDQQTNTISMQINEIKHFITKVEAAFLLPLGSLTRKHPSGRPMKSLHDVDLSEIRKATAYYITSTCDGITLKAVASFIGCAHHASVIHLKRAAANHMEQRCEYFLKHYKTITMIPY